MPYDRHEIEDIPEIQRSHKFYKGVTAIDLLKKIDLDPELEESEVYRRRKWNRRKRTDKEKCIMKFSFCTTVFFAI